jgi:hypothetical protein
VAEALRREHRERRTARERARALQTVLEWLNPVPGRPTCEVRSHQGLFNREAAAALHEALFDIYLDELKEAMGLALVSRVNVPGSDRVAEDARTEMAVTA